MQCERLIQLAKNWFGHVKDETMAPARMIQFIKDHVATCDICLADSDLNDEIEKSPHSFSLTLKFPRLFVYSRKKRK